MPGLPRIPPRKLELYDHADRLALAEMNKNKKRLPEKLKLWKDAGKKLHLSTLHIQMARELGINPKTLGSLDNHRQEPWKAPLPIFLEELYFKRFHKERPERVGSLEKLAREIERKKREKRERKIAARKDVQKTTTPVSPAPASSTVRQETSQEDDGEEEIPF